MRIDAGGRAGFRHLARVIDDRERRGARSGGRKREAYQDELNQNRSAPAVFQPASRAGARHLPRPRRGPELRGNGRHCVDQAGDADDSQLTAAPDVASNQFPLLPVSDAGQQVAFFGEDKPGKTLWFGQMPLE
jgi:hypothetical protein